MAMRLKVAAISLLLLLAATAYADSDRHQPGDAPGGQPGDAPGDDSADAPGGDSGNAPGGQSAGVLDLRNYGAKSNGDSSQALLSAWKDACGAAGKSKIVIPKGTYQLGEVVLEGPCKGPVAVQLDGTLQAPEDAGQFKSDGWIVFQHVDGLTISGSGTLDGQGQKTWQESACPQGGECKEFPMNLKLNYVNNGLISGITSLDSKYFHINIFGCKGVTIVDTTITAPGDSPNTDGIHVGRSTGVQILRTQIGTGDDCISLGDGSVDVYCADIDCGPGHGMAIGSLGKYQNEEPVKNITFENCRITDAMCGTRIKTWPSTVGGSVSDVTFKGITVHNVQTPVKIDQGYCPRGQCKAQIPSQVKLSNINIEDIKGTASTDEPVQIICSKGTPCEGVSVSNIDITYNGGKAKTVCRNVQPKVSGTQNPPVCTDESS